MNRLIPKLFNTAMVQAINAGTKTETRRTKGFEDVDEWIDGFYHCEKEGYILGKGKHPTYGMAQKFYKLPNIPGDVLWVRESYCRVMREHAPDLLEGAQDRNQYVYKASMHDDFMRYASEKYGYKWKPSIHMPFEAARIFLMVKSVGVERLQDITEAAAQTEGIQEFTKDGVGFKYGLDGWNWSAHTGEPFMCTNRRLAFEQLWVSINGQESWDANPWVTVTKFNRIEKEEALERVKLKGKSHVGQ